MSRHWSPRHIVECPKPSCGWWGVRVASTGLHNCPRCNFGGRLKLVLASDHTEAQRKRLESKR